MYAISPAPEASYQRFVKTTPKPRATKKRRGELDPPLPELSFLAGEVVAGGVTLDVGDSVGDGVGVATSDTCLATRSAASPSIWSMTAMVTIEWRVGRGQSRTSAQRDGILVRHGVYKPTNKANRGVSFKAPQVLFLADARSGRMPKFSPASGAYTRQEEKRLLVVRPGETASGRPLNESEEKRGINQSHGRRGEGRQAFNG